MKALPPKRAPKRPFLIGRVTFSGPERLPKPSASPCSGTIFAIKKPAGTGVIAPQLIEKSAALHATCTPEVRFAVRKLSGR
jgi:hypothetical protein